MRANLISKRGKIYVVITYEDFLGETKKKWYGTGLDDTRANKKLAEQIKNEKYDEFRKNYQFNERSGSTMLFADFIEQWLERAKPNLQISTYGTYQMNVQKIAEYFRAKKITLLDLQPMDISDFYSYLQKNGKTVQLCEHYHVNIRKCLQTAVRANLIPYNPADRIDRPKSPKHIAKYYNKDELDNLFECLIGDNYAHIYKITAYYGLRRSEMMGIKWSSIDFKENSITLDHAVVQTRVNKKAVIIAKDRLKNTASYRTLPLLPEIKELLLDLKEKQENNKKLYGDQYNHTFDEYICVDDLGYRLNPETVSSHFRLVLEKNNLKKIRYHDLRHSCASLLLANGIAMKEIQEWLGHSSYNTTANIYSHLDQKAKKNVANVITKVFDEQGDFETFDLDLNNRNEKLEKPSGIKPVFISKVKHKHNRTTPNIELNQTTLNLEETITELRDELKEESIVKKEEKGKSYFVYLNKITGTLGAVKRFSDLTEDHQFIKEVKNRDDVNELMFDLMCGGGVDKDYLTDFGLKLRTKVNNLSNDNEM